MRTRWAIFMSKVHDNSAPKTTLGVCRGMLVQSLAIPCQAWSEFPNAWKAIVEQILAD